MSDRLGVWGFRQFFVVFLILATGFRAFPQPTASLETGIGLFGQGRFREAVAELRLAHDYAPGAGLKAEALFWIGLSELSLGEYGDALRDLEAVARTDPQNPRVGELAYHRGRALYYLGRYNEALVLLKNYADSILPEGPSRADDSSRKAAALYWTGECLYSMGQFDLAGNFFREVADTYPSSPKYEASRYRLALIDQKKVENELLGLLKWSHEESLRNIEDFRRKETAYDQALSAYQRRLSDQSGASAMYDETRVLALEDENAQYREKLVAAEERIRLLENADRASDSSILEKLMSLKSNALDLERAILRSAP